MEDEVVEMKVQLTRKQMKALGACARVGFDGSLKNDPTGGSLTQDDWTKVEEAITGLDNH